MADDPWFDYFYPETVDRHWGIGTLKNLYGERDPVVLARLEYADTAARVRQLQAQPELVDRSFDADHVRAIHRHVFQDVYEWAGEFRTVDIAKGAAPFAAIEDGATGVDDQLRRVRSSVADTDWPNITREAFPLAAAETFAHLNQAHPFREGNGRAAKVFMEHVADLSGFTLDYQAVGADRWNTTSDLSRLPSFDGRSDVSPGKMEAVWNELTSQRRRAPTVDGHRGPQLSPAARAALDASGHARGGSLPSNKPGGVGAESYRASAPGPRDQRYGRGR